MLSLPPRHLAPMHRRIRAVRRILCCNCFRVRIARLSTQLELRTESQLASRAGQRIELMPL